MPSYLPVRRKMLVTATALASDRVQLEQWVGPGVLFGCWDLDPIANP